MSLLESINQPEQLKKLNESQLEQLAGELRELIISTVAANGGHLASNLGMVELTIALLLSFEFPRDKIVFDVGHQAYAWKILTGRREQFASLRCLDGLAGFPKTKESSFDCFNTGHSSTSISAALGLSRAMLHSNRTGHAIAVIGDGALTGGMAFEALNDAGQSGENLLVILNDNQMSIDKNVGGLAHHLEKLRISPPYLRLRSRFEKILQKIPLLGRFILRLTKKFKELARFTVQRQSGYFEQLGFHYYGPIDGHDLPGLVQHLQAIASFQGPVLLHVMTKKGHGYRYAEEAPHLYHGVAPFVIENGLANGQPAAAGPASFSAVFGQTMLDLARDNSKLVLVSAAMTSGTGLSEFAKTYPARFFDVGIAEQHAMTMAAGLAAGGMRPVLALYSTFLQRAYDQLLHDVCLQCLPVVIAIDRAGIVGEDGETHQGIYDLSLLLPLPGLEIFCPADYQGLVSSLKHALASSGPVAVRYPRGGESRTPLPAGRIVAGAQKAALKPPYRINCLRSGQDITLAALGTLAGQALQAADLLAQKGIRAEVLSITCAKPLDLASLLASVTRTKKLIIIEEALVKGGVGQTLLPDLLQLFPGLEFALLGLADRPLCQGKRAELLARENLDAAAIAARARQLLDQA